MAGGWTNRGKFNRDNIVFRGASAPTSFYAVLITDSVTPDVDDNTFADLANEIPAGNGYTSGGIQITRNAAGFPTATEDDANDRSDFTIKDLVWTATGGSLPGSGTGARWIVLTDDNSTLNSREVWAWDDLASNRIATVGQSITHSGWKLRLA